MRSGGGNFVIKSYPGNSYYGKNIWGETSMAKQNMIPAVVVERKGAQVVATAALTLKSILKRSLLAAIGTDGLPRKDDEAGMEKELGGRREAFLNAIAGWPKDTVLELRIVSSPNLAARARGTVDLFLLLRVTAGKKNEAKARLMSRFLSLMPLVFTFMPEAEFNVVGEAAVVRQALAPFRQTHAVAITRRKEEVVLSEIREQQAPGFGKTETAAPPVGRVPHLFPWLAAESDWSQMCLSLIQQFDPYGVIIRLRPSADSKSHRAELFEHVRLCEWLLSTGIRGATALEQQVSLLRDTIIRRMAMLDNPCFDLGVFITGPRAVDGSISNILAGSITQPCHGTRDSFLVFEGGSVCREVAVSDALDVDYFPEDAPFTVAEAAAAFRLPSPPDSDMTGLPLARFRTAVAVIKSEKTDVAGTITICENVHQGVSQSIVISPDDRMRHVFIIGQTGTGKSTLMENMIVQDIINGQGVAVIDPHGDLVEGVIGRIPQKRQADVIVFDVLDQDYPIGMNIIKWNTLQERDLLIDELYLTLDRLYDMHSTGGPIFEAYFRVMLKLLMGRSHRSNFTPTILDFNNCFNNKDFRDWLKRNFEGSAELDGIIEIERAGGELEIKNVAPYVTSKLTRFFNDQGIRHIVGQGSCLDFEKIMNEKKILLVNLGKGRFGNVVSAILANHIVTRFKLAAMKRGNIPPRERKDFFLYVDECHNLPPENFCELLSEARKYRLGLVLATQYAGQLNKAGFSGDNLLSAIFGNVGTKMTFRLGPEDAQLIAPMLYPVFSPLDVIGLSNFQGYVHTNLSNEVTPPFSFRSPKTDVPYDRKAAKAIRKFSQLKYGRHVVEVDHEIYQRRIAWQWTEEEE